MMEEMELVRINTEGQVVDISGLDVYALRRTGLVTVLNNGDLVLYPKDKSDNMKIFAETDPIVGQPYKYHIFDGKNRLRLMITFLRGTTTLPHGRLIFVYSNRFTIGTEDGKSVVVKRVAQEKCLPYNASNRGEKTKTVASFDTTDEAIKWLNENKPNYHDGISYWDEED